MSEKRRIEGPNPAEAEALQDGASSAGAFLRSDAKNVQAASPRWKGLVSSRPEGPLQTGRPERTFEEAYTCICCPLGCRLTVMLAQGEAGLDTLGVVGYKCKRGKDYARQEATRPVRMVTAAVGVEGRLRPVSVKTERPVPKNLVLQVAAALGATRVSPPVHEGDVVLADVCGTGVDAIATKTVE